MGQLRLKTFADKILINKRGRRNAAASLNFQQIILMKYGYVTHFFILLAAGIFIP